VIFENGSVLKFSHMQHEKNAFDHKGGQYSFVAFDEATDFSEMQVMSLLSHLASTNPQLKNTEIFLSPRFLRLRSG
jgi:hypothetical protein